MSVLNFLALGHTCGFCAEAPTLVHVPQSVFSIAHTEPADSIACLECGAAGKIEEVIKEGAPLTGGVLSADQLADMIEALKISSDHSPYSV